MISRSLTSLLIRDLARWKKTRGCQKSNQEVGPPTVKLLRVQEPEALLHHGLKHSPADRGTLGPELVELHQRISLRQLINFD